MQSCICAQVWEKMSQVLKDVMQVLGKLERLKLNADTCNAKNEVFVRIHGEFNKAFDDLQEKKVGDNDGHANPQIALKSFKQTRTECQPFSRVE